MSFVHLHNHSHYSLLDGLTKIDELIQRAIEDGAPAVALTDHGSMYGVIEFYQKAKKAGIKPIIGVEAYLAPNLMSDKNTKQDERNYHLLLLAKNLTGYQNLLKLVSIAHLEGFYYKPRIDWPTLAKHAEGLICSTACLGGEIPQLIQAGNMNKARKRILEYQGLFGKGNFYLEIQHHPDLEGQAETNRSMIALAHELRIPLVATNDIHYLKKEDYDVQDVLLCLQTKKKLDDKDRMEMHGSDFYYKPAVEMIEAFKEAPEAVKNTLAVAEACDLELELGNIQLPGFSLPDGRTEDDYLKQLCLEGIKNRYGLDYEALDRVKKERLDYELSVIAKMGWPSYFLIVADFVNWAKKNKIVVGPGRGSAAGSFVCYLTGITNLDPLEYDLLFERFLNPDRISMPDIDMDFADTRRDEVIRYVEGKYGKDHVAQIITFGTMAARAAIRDVGRVLDYPYDFCDRLAKMIPPMAKFKEAMETAELKEIYNSDPNAKKLIDFARRLEGVARHASTHACGVVITPRPLTDYMPVQYASTSDRNIVSQYSLHPIEDLGLLKMDFLGLKNLTIIESAIKIIKNTRGLEIDIDKIPLNDQASYRLFQDGETTGVFQFESSGMKRYLRELKPSEFEDLIAMVALYRPGPMEWIPDFIAGKHGRKKPKYLHPKLEPILKKTYGVAIYQEQVMQMARDLAGFTMAEADVLRKAVGKKIAKLLSEQKEKFVDGCVKNGISSQLAETIFSFIEPFAGYGFNRSHAACYALIAYQTAYLKANWPTEFMAALLTSDQGDTDRIAIEIEECRRVGISVAAPDINESYGSFTVVTSGTAENRVVSPDEKLNTIRFGLKAVKNIGENIADAIIKERKDNGPFAGISDLLERVTDKDLNKKSLESLIKSGALDGFGERGMLLANMELMLSFNREVSKNAGSGQSSLFSLAPAAIAKHQLRMQSAPAVGQQEKLSWEKELLGLYISEHPFNEFKKALASIITPIADLKNADRDSSVVVGGVISGVKKIITRSNEAMLFVKIEDQLASVEVLVFPSLLKTTGAVWQEGAVILCAGRVSDKDQDIKLLASKATQLTIGKLQAELEQFDKIREVGRFKNGNGNGNGWKRSEPAAPIPAPTGVAAKENCLKIIFNQSIEPVVLSKLKILFDKNTGSDKVYFKIIAAAGSQIIETSFKVNKTKELISAIRGLGAAGLTVLDN